MTETPVGPYKLIAPVAQPLIQARNAHSLDRLETLIKRAMPRNGA